MCTRMNWSAILILLTAFVVSMLAFPKIAAAETRWAWWDTLPQETMFNAVWGANAYNVWIVGDNGTILKWDGSAWTQQSSGTARHLYGVWGIDTENVWAVGSAGTILRWDGSAWTLEESGVDFDLNDIWGFDAYNVWAVGWGDNAILKWDGATWAQQNSGTSKLLSAVWGTDTDNVWAVGYDYAAASGTILRWDGVAWDAQYMTTTESLYGVWGVDAQNIWAVGASGTIVKWDGNTWSVQPSGTPLQLYDVWGTDASNVWVVGSSGTILRWNEDAWRQQVTGIEHFLKDVWGTNTNEVWVAGSASTILHYTQVSVAKMGNGDGVVIGNPIGINCGITCTATYRFGVTVTLIANADNGSVFAGWSGDCSGVNPVCQVVMNASKVTTATFDVVYPLTVVRERADDSEGAVVSLDGGINCGVTCTAEYRAGTVITLTAAPVENSAFAGWSGACGGDRLCTVVVNNAKVVTATFSQDTGNHIQTVGSHVVSQTIVFTAALPIANIDRCSWDFDDGITAPCELVGADTNAASSHVLTVQATHFYSSPGNYVVQVTASNAAGATRMTLPVRILLRLFVPVIAR